MNKIKLITTDTNFNIFDVLIDELNGKTGGLIGRNLIFCEEKISLMTERRIAEKFGGSFNTEVYSFGNYLRVKKSLNKVLSKEGSAMAIRKILSSIDLKCLSQKDGNLASSLYNLFVLLKSSKISSEDLERSIDGTRGILKNKLTDLVAIYKRYDAFLQEKDIEDQSSLLGYLPSVIESDSKMADTDVFLLGYSSFTEQAREVVKTLLKKAKSVTAILVGGNNQFLYLNETVNTFRNLCKLTGAELTEKTVLTKFNPESELIKNKIFNPSKQKDKLDTSNVYMVTAKTPTDEIEVLASTVKSEVINGKARYRDFTVVIPKNDGYGEKIKRVFSSFDIPYFLDEKKKPLNNPLIKLIVSYIDCFRKNLERETLSGFYKNPLFCKDKSVSDDFYNYVKAFNVNFNRIKQPFTYGVDQDKLLGFENFRQKIVKCFESFNIYKLLEDLSVKENLIVFSQELLKVGEVEEAKINDQIYDYVIKLLNDMDVLLGGVKVSYTERKRIFISGVNALELSIIPQYKDAVFVGGFKEASLAKAKTLYVLGLTDAIPETKDDVALLNDKDIKVLSNAEILIEPNIKIVNDREKENAGLALCSFEDRLFLSYGAISENGKKTFKSRILDCIDNLVTVKPYYYKGGYLTYKEGVKSFALACKRFAEGKIVDFEDASDFYHQTSGDQTVKGLLNRAEKKVDGKLNNLSTDLSKYVSSPTAIEEFYSCPYRAFIKKILSVKEPDDGKLSGLSTGNFLHDVLNGYLSRYEEVTDENAFNKIIEEEILKVISKEEYKRYADNDSNADFDRVIREARSYSAKTEKHLKHSSFKPSRLEEWGELPLLDGKVTLYGKIDRIDESNDYYRVIDYKTGKYDASSRALFSGSKLQLYLYSKMIELMGIKDKKLAGLFYAPISDAYAEKEDKSEFLFDGKVLDENGVMELHGESGNLTNVGVIKVSSRTKKSVVLTAEALNAHVKYAIKMCENAVASISEGFIPSSPLKGACKYCKYIGVCDKESFNEREILSVSAETVVESVKESEK